MAIMKPTIVQKENSKTKHNDYYWSMYKNIEECNKHLVSLNLPTIDMIIDKKYNKDQSLDTMTDNISKILGNIHEIKEKITSNLENNFATLIASAFLSRSENDCQTYMLEFLSNEVTI
jgi:hypothetical protein